METATFPMHDHNEAETLYLLSLFTVLIFIFALLWKMGFRPVKYAQQIKNKSLSEVVMGVHMLLATLIGCLLPNNYLATYPSLKILFEEEPFWIPLSIAIGIIVAFVALGGLFVFLGNVHIKVTYGKTDSQ